MRLGPGEFYDPTGLSNSVAEFARHEFLRAIERNPSARERTLGKLYADISPHYNPRTLHERAPWPVVDDSVYETMKKWKVERNLGPNKLGAWAEDQAHFTLICRSAGRIGFD